MDDLSKKQILDLGEKYDIAVNTMAHIEKIVKDEKIMDIDRLFRVMSLIEKFKENYNIDDLEDEVAVLPDLDK